MSKNFDYRYILNKIDFYRKRKGWTISELTSQADLSSGTIYEWYNNGKQPTLNKLGAVCEALDISLYTLFARGEEQTLSAQKDELIRLCEDMSSKDIETLLVTARILRKKRD